MPILFHQHHIIIYLNNEWASCSIGLYSVGALRYTTPSKQPSNTLGKIMSQHIRQDSLQISPRNLACTDVLRHKDSFVNNRYQDNDLAAITHGFGMNELILFLQVSGSEPGLFEPEYNLVKLSPVNSIISVPTATVGKSPARRYHRRY